MPTKIGSEATTIGIRLGANQLNLSRKASAFAATISKISIHTCATMRRLMVLDNLGIFLITQAASGLSECLLSSNRLYLKCGHYRLPLPVATGTIVRHKIFKSRPND